MTDTGSETGQANSLLAVADLLVVAGYATLVVGLVLTGVVTGALRVLLVGALLGFCPGYAVVSALYPVRSPRGQAGQPYTSWAHRAALAVGTSLFVLVLAAFPLTLLGFGTAAVLGVVLATTLGCVAIGGWQRLQIPADQRIKLPLEALANEARAATVDAPRRDAVLNVALALAVVAGVATLAVGLAAPDRGATYSEVALANGGAAGDTTYTQGSEVSLPLAVENHADGVQSYTAFVVLERVGETGDGVAVVERAVLSRSTVTVPAGETRTSELSFTPSLRGTELRLSIYVYEGEAPETAAPESAEYHLYQWVTVEEGPNSLASDPATSNEG